MYSPPMKNATTEQQECHTPEVEVGNAARRTSSVLKQLEKSARGVTPVLVVQCGGCGRSYRTNSWAGHIRKQAACAVCCDRSPKTDDGKRKAELARLERWKKYRAQKELERSQPKKTFTKAMLIECLEDATKKIAQGS